MLLPSGAVCGFALSPFSDPPSSTFISLFSWLGWSALQSCPVGAVLLSSPCCVQPMCTCCLQALPRDPPHLSGTGRRWECAPTTGRAAMKLDLPYALLSCPAPVGPQGSEEEQNNSGNVAAHDRKAIVISFDSVR